MDDNNKNIFDVLESPSTKSINDFKIKSTTTTISSNSILSIRRSHLPLMNAGNGFYSTSSPSPKLPAADEYQRKKRTDRALHGLGFINPGPKNLVNVANVPSTRTKTRQPTTQEKP
ncbi:unnamed protein product, partial [Rotaria sp. Silwood1]